MEDWDLEPSVRSENTLFPVKDIIDTVPTPGNSHRSIHFIGFGGPTENVDFSAYPFAVDIVSRHLVAGKGNGYTDSLGWLPAREAIAREYSYENMKITHEEVIIDIAGFGAINTTIQVFLNPGDNILIPSPGYPLYMTMALNMSAEAITYDLKHQSGWEVDLEDLERKVTDRTKLLVVLNPSNPCGSVYSKEHLLDILQWASRHKICILADEVYNRMTFGKPYYPLGSLTDDVPVFTIGSLGKIFFAPGWRCGWVIIYDKYNKCQKLRGALNKVKNMLLHPAPFIMQAIPELFEKRPADYFEEIMKKIKISAELVKRNIDEIPQLHMEMSEGSPYCMVSINFEQLDVKNSVEFAHKFLSEHDVMVMPAEAFHSHSGFRINLYFSLDVLQDCMNKLKKFVNDHLHE